MRQNAFRYLILATLAVGASAIPLSAQRGLDTVRVSTRAADRGGFSLEVIDRAALDRLPGLTLPQLLARALGVDVQARSGASADVAVRGGSYQQALVLVDGVRATDAQTAHFSLDLAVPLDDVERIEVLRGGASALHGPDAAGGVINVVTRRGASRSARLEGGSFGSARVAVAAGAGTARGAARLAAEYGTSDGARAGTDHDAQLVRVAIDRAIGGVRFGLDGAWARRDFGANAFYGPYDSQERTATTTLALRAERRLGATRDVRGVVSYRRHDDDFILRRTNPTGYRNLHTNTSIFAELTLRQPVGRRGTIATGIEAGRLSLASFRLGDRSEGRLAAFVEGAHEVGRATMTAAARVDHSSITGTAMSPSVTFRLPLNERFTARASVARGIRAPSWTERYYVDPVNRGTPTLGMERFWTGDVAVRHEFRDGAAAEVTVFGRRSNDLIDWTRPAGPLPAGTPWVARNIGNATLHGAELAAELARFGGLDWRVRAQGMRFVTDLPTAMVGKYALRPLTRSGGVTATRVLSRNVRASVDLVHARRAAETGYTTVDARLAWRRGSWGVTVDGTNLGRARWIDVSGMPAPGPGLFTGVRWMGR